MKRPTAVTVFGVLNIVFAIFGFFAMLVSAILLVPHADTKNPVIRLIHDNPAYAAWIYASMTLGLLAIAAKLAAGIGLLKLRPWARQLSIIYAIYAMVMIVVGTVVNYFFLLRPLLEQAQQKQGAEAVGAMVGAIGGTIGGCFGLIYPVLLLIFMMRPNVVAAFAGGNPSGAPLAGNQP